MPDDTRRFKEERVRYEKFTIKLRALVTDLLASEGIDAVIEGRTKSVESFAGKVTRPGKAYQDPLHEITDLSGIRVVLRTLNDVNQVGSLIEREFVVDSARSVKKSEHLDADRFGYLSEHYIVQLKEPRIHLPEWEPLQGLNAEIQVRTILQHAWATVQHSLDYKSKYDIPNQLRRRLFRLSALFELADQELNAISSDASTLFSQYKVQVQSAKEDIELNVDSLKAYVENSETVAHWAKYMEGLGVEVGRIASGPISRDIEMARMAGLSTIREVEDMISVASSWGEPYLRDFFHNTFGNPIPKGRCYMERNGVVTIFLIGSFVDVFSDNILDRQFGWGDPERATKPARKHNPRFREERGCCAMRLHKEMEGSILRNRHAGADSKPPHAASDRKTAVVNG